MQKEYFIGLDVGTESVGWAVTDMEYNIIKANGKSLWGVRLFDAAKTAEERRIFRAGRRRLQRRNQRIKLLREIFAEQIFKVDEEFYIRMRESKFFPQDKAVDCKYTLFNDADFNDKEFHKKYPTIYHLRKELIASREPHDVRLVYLALHHIMKHRGHFLFEGNDFSAVGTFKDVFPALTSILWNEYEISWENVNLLTLEEVLMDRKQTITAKKSKCMEVLSIAKSVKGADEEVRKNKIEKAIVALLCGGKAELKDIYKDVDFESIKSSISFDDSDYEEKKDQLRNLLMESYNLLETAKAVYDWSVLIGILGGESYLSSAKVKIYEKHKSDLAMLKTIIKEYLPEKYKEVFSSDIAAGYSAYIGCQKSKGKNRFAEKTCTQEEFCKYILKVLHEIKTEDNRITYLRNEAELKTLLPKQVIKDNGVIPYQVHKAEMEQILKNAEGYLPFLTVMDESGLTASEKILAIMEFRIPYYVGPLNDHQKRIGNSKANCWIVKKSNEAIRPWNFEQVVDKEASSEAFIKRMTNECTYLPGEDVLPKNSLLYSRFMVLNELNNLKINGEKPSVELKQEIYEELFKNRKKVTEKGLKSFLKQKGYKDSDIVISGIDGDFKSNLGSYQTMQSILGDKVENEDKIDEIIDKVTLFGEDKKILKATLKSKYGDFLSEDEINKIAKLSFAGWGRLSRKFLKEIIHIDQSTGEYISIISALYETNNNLMQLLSSEFTYMNTIEEYRKEALGVVDKIQYSMVEDLYVSSAIRRSIWQTLLIVKEIKKVMGHDPKRIFIEMARGPEEKKRTVSRKATLVELYKKCKEETNDWIAELEGKSDADLRNNRLYLYYTQMGRCMYTGQPIKLSELYTNYDIDHIYPQSITTDDSLDNKVLVLREENAKKSDNYPIASDIRNNMYGFWTMLKEKGFILEKKYERLKRSTPLTNDELSGFIARQLVETRQSTKALAEILKNVFDKSEIVYAKAQNVSNFRKQYDLLKVREINDYHHAKDAYLNIAIGNVYHTKFTNNPRNFIKSAPKRSYNLKIDKMLSQRVERDGIVAWEVENNKSLSTVKRTMEKNNVLFTRYAIEEKGGFFKQQILKAGKGQVQIKNEGRIDIEHYGGYDKAKGTYFMLVESDGKKGKRIRTLEFVPLYLEKQISKNTEAADKYCRENLCLQNPIILVQRIKKDALFKIDGSYLHISGRTGDRILFKNANQLVISHEWNNYIKKLVKFSERRKKYSKPEQCLITEYDLINEEENESLYELFIEKLDKSVYKANLSAQIKTLNDKRENFVKGTIEEQALVLLQILLFFACNPILTDLSIIKGPANVGTILKNKEISRLDEIKLINQSPTGVFSNEIDLLKI